ncbi:putative MFS family arabinose efflux permease [Streptomyces sp. Amel2xB2]|uniref:MFS transporter n=1 Tax=Streptomyces sp. Amel2xB2 TaxID=1305829 RepID=UPI000DBA0EA5|nr:MFS transporter [Streptomyces sp. Amel2xB2]RAJ58367.1 putative MFS family arabinose efflux permease [Streptomyces sp. Amel2xB2]
MTFTARDASRGVGTSSAGGLADRNFLLLLVATACAFSNYAPMLSVVPLWSDDGGAGTAGAGAATGVTMGTTVAVQLCMPWLLRKLSLLAIFAVGAVLLGAPTFGYLLSSQLTPVLGVSAVRGVGFGMVAVAGSALVAELVTEDKRGRAVGWYGIAVGLPQVVCLPLAVWGVESWGYTAVFTVSAVLSVAAAPLIWAVSADTRQRGSRPSTADGRRSGVVEQWRPLLNPWTVLITAACALGGVTSLLPLALDDVDVAATALFVLSATVIAGRWGAGWLSDRLGPGRLLVASVLACAAGMAGFAAAVAGAPPWPVSMAAAAVYGLGFGVLQNDTLVVMFARAGPRGSGLASTAWNMAYDAGTGVGAAGVGVISGAFTMGGAFAAAAAVIVAAAPLAWLSGRRAGSARGVRHKSPPPDDPTDDIRSHTG